MKTKIIIKTSAGIAISAFVLLGMTTFAFAQGSNNSDQPSSSSSQKEVLKKNKKISSIKTSQKTKINQSSLVTKSNNEIQKRIKDLGDLSTKISDMKNLSDSEKASMSSSIDNEVKTLNGLKDKIESDTDPVTLKSDIKSITADNRVYDLFIPKTRISAANDKSVTVINMLTAMGSKLQARISATESSGKDVTALNNALVDFNAKLAEAKSLSDSIKNGVETLNPDQGSKAVKTSNETALSAARKNLSIIEADLNAARKDTKTIMSGIKGVGQSATATSTSSEVESDNTASSTNQ